MKKILMCPPRFYGVEYQINPWMDTAVTVDKEAALKSYTEIKQSYLQCGLEVMELEPEEGLPDMVFAANHGYAERNIFIKANFKHAERKKESNFARDFFLQNNFEVFEIPEEINFEGEGDVIRSESKYFLGYGKRSDLASKEYLENYTGKKFQALELNDPFFYHLDTCFAPLNDDVVVINPKSFPENSLEKIRKNFSRIIETGESDNKLLACNFVVAGKTVIMNKGVSEQLKEKINKENFSIIEIDMHEFLFGGGGVKCCTLEIFDN